MNEEIRRNEEVPDEEMAQASGGAEGIVPTLLVHCPGEIGELYGKHIQE